MGKEKQEFCIKLKERALTNSIRGDPEVVSCLGDRKMRKLLFMLVFIAVLPMYPADLMLVKQKLSWQRSGPDCKCQFKNWHNSKVFKKITVFLPFFDFDQIDVKIGVFCLQNILSFSSEITICR